MTINGNDHSTTKMNTMAEANIPDNYVSYTLKNQKALPLRAILGITPMLGTVGGYFTSLRWETALWAVTYYYMTGLGITAGYDRLWAHRSYNVSRPLQIALALLGAGAVEGSIKWRARGHRAHHQYTDTDLDPYNARKRVLWSHIGWMIIKPRCRPGVADMVTSRHYLKLVVIMGIVLPTVVPGLGWGDWQGGYVYVGLLRLLFIHHSRPSTTSIPPCDHLISARITIDEGYHNFHHQLPMDYRNAIRWYQYDLTKWSARRLALPPISRYGTFPENEVRKGQLTMHLKRLREAQETLTWPSDNSHLPHPGGRHLAKNVERDAATAFFGGVYDHSNAAHNVTVGILYGGAPHGLEDKMIPPSQRLRVARYNEIGGSGYSSAALSDGEGLLG
ncbi:delta 9-fatty acid desaturase protein [Pisolithus thermaeus]|nr:delta 9-fatty acid desaturase protein [Pisolithus thermaeus]